MKLNMMERNGQQIFSLIRGDSEGHIMVWNIPNYPPDEIDVSISLVHINKIKHFNY